MRTGAESEWGNRLSQIYFHADFDGVVSAAMLLYWSRRVEAISLHSVDYHLKSTWAERRLPPYSAVVDFLFHPDAFVWVDHHVNPFVRQDWADVFRPNERMRWERGAPCCPVVIRELLGSSFDWAAYFEDYIKWSILIDSGSYESPQEATDLSNPYVLLSKVISAASESVQIELAQAVAAGPVGDVLVSSEAVRLLVREMRAVDEQVRMRLGELVRYDGTIALFDQSAYRWPYQRYHPYLLYPEARFVVGLYVVEGGYSVSLGANPWRERPPFHLGKICESFGGGGHFQVGGVTSKSLLEARRVATGLCDAVLRVLEQQKA